MTMRASSLSKGLLSLSAASLALAACSAPSGSDGNAANAASVTDESSTVLNEAGAAEPGTSADGAAAEKTPVAAAKMRGDDAQQPFTPPAPGEPGGLPDDRTPVSEAPFTADSAQGAANVVQTYYALIGAGKYAQAYRLWEPGAAGKNAGAFAADFGQYSEYRANIGAPGRIDSGAGQRYVTVPVQVYGRMKNGRTFNLRGSAVLHRAGDVPGATAAQKTWRIRSIDAKPMGNQGNGAGQAAPGPRPRPEDQVEDNRSTARYRCMDGSRLVAAFDPDNRRVTVSRGGRTLATLPDQRVASGIRYAARGYELRGKGSDITFTAPGQPPIACRILD